MRWFLCRYFSPRSSTPLLCPDAEAQQDFCSRNPVNLPKRFGRKETSVKMKRKGIQSDDSIVKEKTVNKIKTMLIKTRIMKPQRIIALMPWPLPTMVFPESVLSTARVPVTQTSFDLSSQSRYHIADSRRRHRKHGASGKRPARLIFRTQNPAEHLLCRVFLFVCSYLAWASATSLPCTR